MTKNHPMFSKSHAAEGADQVVLPAAADVGWWEGPQKVVIYP